MAELWFAKVVRAGRAKSWNERKHPEWQRLSIQQTGKPYPHPHAHCNRVHNNQDLHKA